MSNDSKTKATRRSILVAGAALTAGGIGGRAATAANDGLAANKATALNLSRAIMTGDWTTAEALLADDFQYIGDGQPAIDKAAYLGFMRGVLSSAFSDMEMAFPRVLAEGALVAVDYTNAMTNVGVFFGIPATGKRVLATGQFIREIRDGKVVNEWQTTNAAGLVAQLTGG